jgi:aminotransferase EvaB
MLKYWDYLREYNENKKKILKKVDSVLKSGNLFFGKELNKFEKDFCKYNNSKYGVGVANGTDAIFIALKAINVGKGDEIITVSNTAIPTVAAIRNTGANVRFVDINEDYLINVKKLQSVITSKTRAILPVHLYGQICDMNEVLSVAKKNNLFVIEDCAQACGALHKNKKAGSLGDIGCYSFYPTKILGAYGDGGFITTNNKKIFEKIHKLRFYGMERMNKSSFWYNKYYALYNGVNSRLSEIQAAILNIKFSYIDTFIKRRNEIAKIYFNELKNTDLKLPIINEGNFHVFHLFTVSHPKRNIILREMKKKKIDLNIYYPYPIHAMKAYSDSVCQNCNCLKKTEDFSKKIFSLPLYPTLKNSEVIYIAKSIKEIILKI